MSLENPEATRPNRQGAIGYLSQPRVNRLLDVASADERAPDELITACLPLATYVLVTGGYYLPNAEKDDLLNMALADLSETLANNRYDETRGSFGNFAELVLRRRMIDAVKSATSGKQEILNQAVPLDEWRQNSEGNPMPPLSDTLSDDVSTEDVVMARETLRGLPKALSALSAMELKCILLTGQGLSYEEAATQMRLGVKSIDNANQRARRKLAYYFETGNVPVPDEQTTNRPFDVLVDKGGVRKPYVGRKQAQAFTQAKGYDSRIMNNTMSRIFDWSPEAYLVIDSGAQSIQGINLYALPKVASIIKGVPLMSKRDTISRGGCLSGITPEGKEQFAEFYGHIRALLGQAGDSVDGGGDYDRAKNVG